MADDRSRAAVPYATSALLEFVNRTHAHHDAALDRAFATPQTASIPAIQVAPAEGKLLAVLLRQIRAERVVEVGTLAGYSGIWIARALVPSPRAHLWTVELDPKNASLARDNFAAAGVSDRVTVVEGRARDVLETLAAHGPFDAVFVDADKGSYDHYGRWAAQHLRSGGLLLGDNAFFFGKLLDDTPDAAAMRRFHLEAAEKFDTVCVSTPDGLLVGVKK